MYVMHAAAIVIVHIYTLSLKETDNMHSTNNTISEYLCMQGMSSVCMGFHRYMDVVNFAVR